MDAVFGSFVNVSLGLNAFGQTLLLLSKLELNLLLLVHRLLNRY